jgi:hypothetical protein
MAPLDLDRGRICGFLDAVGRRLSGEWLLVGGAAAAVWFSEGRVTEDIDLVGLEGTPGERLRLMELAAEEGLPVEAVNSAADFFLRRIEGWRDHIELLLRGPSATIHRPDATLFLLLKCTRLSEVDLGDCLALLDFVRAHGLALDRARVLRAIGDLPAASEAALRMRRARLEAALRT